MSEHNASPTPTTDHALQRRAFQVHAAAFTAGMVLIFVVNLLVNLSAGVGGQLSAWWSLWALIGWGLGVAVHGFVGWLARPTQPVAG